MFVFFFYGTAAAAVYPACHTRSRHAVLPISEQAGLLGPVEREQRVPQILVRLVQACLPAHMALGDRAGRRAILQSRRREGERHLAERDFEAGFPTGEVEGVADDFMEPRKLGRA